jgi:hypothetical protein
MKNALFREWIQKCNQRLHKLAGMMNAGFEKYSLRQKKIMLICFCMLCAIFCVLAIVNTCTKIGSVRLKFTPLQLPPHIGKSFSMPAPFISKETFDRIEYFKNHLDSATKASRPGLIDSIRQFEEIYSTQSKK